MFYVYVLKSGKDGNAYIGSTNDLQKRLSEHNGAKVASTRSRVPFELVYYEAYKVERDARLRESRLKLRSKLTPSSRSASKRVLPDLVWGRDRSGWKNWYDGNGRFGTA